MTDPAAIALATESHDLLRVRGETVATAESLTGGLVGAALTDVAGASATYRGGLVVYATDLKVTLAGAPPGLVEERGAVDPDVAGALAVGVRSRLRATWGLALTGVAGPEPQDGKPVGTLYVGVSHDGDEPSVASFTLSGDRAAIRTAAVRCALTVLRDSVATRE